MKTYQLFKMESDFTLLFHTINHICFKNYCVFKTRIDFDFTDGQISYNPTDQSVSVSAQYYSEHGVYDDDLIQLLYNEMVKAFCYQALEASPENVPITDLKEIVAKRKGYYIDGHAYLLPEAVSEIKEDCEKILQLIGETRQLQN